MFNQLIRVKRILSTYQSQDEITKSRMRVKCIFIIIHLMCVFKIKLGFFLFNDLQIQIGEQTSYHVKRQYCAKCKILKLL